MQSWRGNRNNADILLLEPSVFLGAKCTGNNLCIQLHVSLKTCDKLFGQNTFC
ncbi:hypothetical protein BT69DRAFT_1289344 [Atractiella rhizophila]|nr:hypothetical protein BT69DRAFT_1289344 [Atractiella rhizophila]